MANHDDVKPLHPDESGPPELDERLVARVVGKRLLIGLTYVKYDGELIEQTQFHGIVEQITMRSGTVLRLPDGSELRLPPDLRGLQEVPPGTYRLVQLMLGHADMKQTQRYLNITDEELRKAMTGVWERRRRLRAVGQ
jgi:hypothetical protein